MEETDSHWYEDTKNTILAATNLEDIEALAAIRAEAEEKFIAAMRLASSQPAAVNYQEIVRRSERGLGIVLLRLQAKQMVMARGDNRKRNRTHKLSVKDFFGNNNARRDAIVFAETTSTGFEDALSKGREAGNLSRANLSRLVRAQKQQQQPKTENARHEVLHRTLHLKMERVIGETVDGIDDLVSSFNTLFERSHYADLPPEECEAWIKSLDGSLRTLRLIRKELLKQWQTGFREAQS